MSLAACPGVTTQTMELEAVDWPLVGQSFDGIVVTNYLWRPRWSMCWRYWLRWMLIY